MGQASSSEDVLVVKAWKSDTNYPKPSDYPENDLPELQSKPSTAIAFSGGGTRAYVSAIGFLAGLRDLDLLPDVRYIGGVNGGAWATAVFCYGDPSISDDVLLGPIYPPEKISMEVLDRMNENCARRLSSNNFLFEAILKVAIDKSTAWSDAVSEKFLKPVGINQGKYFTWSKSILDNIILRNGSVGLKHDDFILPRKRNGPFPVIGWTFAGPDRSATENPYDAKNNHFRFFDVTPLYVGQFSNEYATFGSEKIRLGGVIEPYGFAISGGQAPEFGLQASDLSGELLVPKPIKSLDLTNAVSISSFNPGTVFDSYSISDMILYPLTCNYWSPAVETPWMQKTLYADGGAVQNIPLISFIQRGVEKIIAVSSTYTPINFVALQDYNSSQHWWRTKHIRSNDIDVTLASFFGILPLQESIPDSKISADYRRNHVFQTAQFDNLIEGFRQASFKGHGITYRQIWITVDNPFYGIEAGREVDVTFVYLDMLKEWEGRLKSSMKELIFSGPRDSFMAAANLFQPEEFAGFPHYDSNRWSLSNRESNLLANLVGWSVVENKDIFEDVLSHNPSPKNNKPFKSPIYVPSPVPKDEDDMILLSDDENGNDDNDIGNNNDDEEVEVDLTLRLGPTVLDKVLANEELKQELKPFEESTVDSMNKSSDETKEEDMNVNVKKSSSHVHFKEALTEYIGDDTKNDVNGYGNGKDKDQSQDQNQSNIPWSKNNKDSIDNNVEKKEEVKLVEEKEKNEEYERLSQELIAVAEAEQARIAAAAAEEEEEKARITAEEEEKARITTAAAEEEKARITAAAEEEEKARIAAAAEEEEKARITAAEEEEKARITAAEEEEEKARITAAEEEEEEKARITAEEEEKTRITAATEEEEEKARITAAAAEEEEKTRIAAEEEKARITAAEEEEEKARITAAAEEEEEEEEKARITAAEEEEEEEEKARITAAAAEEEEKARIAAEEEEKARITAAAEEEEEEEEKARITAAEEEEEEEEEKARITAAAAEEEEKARIAAEEEEKARITAAAAEEEEKARIAAEEEEEKARIATAEEQARKEAETKRITEEETEAKAKADELERIAIEVAALLTRSKQQIPENSIIRVKSTESRPSSMAISSAVVGEDQTISFSGVIPVESDDVPKESIQEDAPFPVENESNLEELNGEPLRIQSIEYYDSDTISTKDIRTNNIEQTASMNEPNAEPISEAISEAIAEAISESISKLVTGTISEPIVTERNQSELEISSILATKDETNELNLSSDRLNFSTIDSVEDNNQVISSESTETVPVSNDIPTTTEIVEPMKDPVVEPMLTSESKSLPIENSNPERTSETLEYKEEWENDPAVIETVDLNTLTFNDNDNDYDSFGNSYEPQFESNNNNNSNNGSCKSDITVNINTNVDTKMENDSTAVNENQSPDNVSITDDDSLEAVGMIRTSGLEVQTDSHIDIHEGFGVHPHRVHIPSPTMHVISEEESKSADEFHIYPPNDVPTESSRHSPIPTPLQTSPVISSPVNNSPFLEMNKTNPPLSPLVSMVNPASPVSVTQLYTIEDIKANKIPGMNITKKEDYLDDTMFLQVFAMDKKSFEAMPKWKRDQQKKKVGLF